MSSSPLLSSARFRGVRGRRRVWVAIAVLVVLGGSALYQVGVRAHRAPSFRVGGTFAPQAELPAGATVEAAAVPESPATTPSSTSTTRVAAKVPTSVKAVRPTSPASTPSSVQGAPSSATSVPPIPAAGTYTWHVDGTEAATGFGRRSLPSTMTMVAHGGDGVGANQIALDTTYSSDHTEREVLSYGADGVVMSFEGGQVRFGPMTQTNQGDYRPALLQVPWRLAAGGHRSGVTDVLDGSGNVQRRESWSVTVAGQETLVSDGHSVPTWKVQVDRQSEPGSSQQVQRSRTYWFDPARSLWVKYTEKMHGEQSQFGVTFTYDNDLTATLVSYRGS